MYSEQEIESEILRILQIPLLSSDYMLFGCNSEGVDEFKLTFLERISFGMQLDTFVVLIKTDGFFVVVGDDLLMILTTSLISYSVTKEKSI
ncbi:MAG: hypothetical protein DA329_03530 [Candidatus Nitrosocosmicus sp.]|uniref:hypothetical protein n=1 Tax=Candidatus Nitrosocosmicus sp. FF01 TaxID=3397670 RepID=UPI002A6FA409|nr:hypothetical protein [Candidatus Nitrosocosmicus sp.]